jgi:hypothetical protein
MDLALNLKEIRFKTIEEIKKKAKANDVFLLEYIENYDVSFFPDLDEFLENLEDDLDEFVEDMIWGINDYRRELSEGE